MKQFKIPKTALKMQKVCSKDATRQQLTGVHFKKQAIMATNGYCAILRKIDDSGLIPVGETWKFSGKKPPKNPDDYFFRVEDNNALDISGKVGNAEIIKSSLYPTIATVLPRNLRCCKFITINAKLLLELATAMTEDSIVTLAVGGEEDVIVVSKSTDPDVIGVIMPMMSGTSTNETLIKTTKTLANVRASLKEGD